jgi:ABC-type transport system substrate-binding protein
LYSPALANLTGAIIPHHVWNPVAWKEEAIRKERSPEDLGISAKDYNVIRALPAMERDFRHKPSVHGPFVLEPLNGESRPLWKSAERVTLRRNEFGWQHKPTYQFLDFLLFDPQLGMETAEIAFLSGNMDLYTARPFQVDRYSKMTEQYYVLERPTTTYEYLGFNCRKGPLANKRVRLAMSMAIDVEKIIKYVEYDQAQRIAGPAYPVLPWYDKDYRREHTWLSGPDKGKTEKLEFIPYNIEEAQAILKE